MSSEITEGIARLIYLKYHSSGEWDTWETASPAEKLMCFEDVAQIISYLKSQIEEMENPFREYSDAERNSLPSSDHFTLNTMSRSDSCHKAYKQCKQAILGKLQSS